jgi:hypothetical protein
MGVVLEYEDSENVHEHVYAIAKNELPPSALEQLTDTTHTYRSTVFHSAETFKQQLPFYVVKPFYTRLVQVFYKSGLPLTKATMMPSLIAYFLMAMLLLYWLEKYFSVLVAAIAAFAIVIWSPILMISRTSGPDALSALLLVGTLYCMLEKRNEAIMYFLLLLSILARLDNILPAVLFIAVHVYYKQHAWKQRIKTGAVLMTGCFLSYFFVAALATNYGWNNFFYSDFYHHLNPEYNMDTTFTIQGYLALVKSQFMTGLYYSQLPLFFFLSLAWITFRRRVESDTMLIAAIWVIIIVRFILHPVVADRLYVGYYLVILMIVFKSRLIT